MTFLPQFIATGDQQAAGKLLFLGLYFLTVAFPICAVIILLADRISEYLRRSLRVLRAVDWLFASVFAAFAVRVLLEPDRRPGKAARLARRRVSRVFAQWPEERPVRPRGSQSP